ncbi:DUF2207 domain-containing protein [Tessaracoccus caeni]|uniref:DUF2207 domain-containing protein n=1 Tax=Tessaracoccus caeni TaxID=3031239 RepID=UPI0023DA8133|nr:DUF2207 domain-containing protein [Tessaracoccus caeni]MDF1489452.1 DUF2207 domain-containing protein [Tessaracoccus caeni]
MSTVELGLVVISAALCVALFLLGALRQRFFRDRMFQGLTPGLLPARGQQPPVVKVGPGREYSGEVAVAFSPPRGLRPGLVGTIVDGEAEMRDVMATIVDLAIRGHLRIKAIGATQPGERKTKPTDRDWEITLVAPKPADTLDFFEVSLLQSMFGAQLLAPKTIAMKAWSKSNRDAITQLRDELYRQTVENNWYPRNPHTSGRGCLPTLMVGVLLLWCVLMLIAAPGWITVLASVLVIAAGVFAYRRLGSRVPRTAAGTAIRIQALGFKKYLETAEAAQLSTEEALGTFSRYLPYALVFGITAHWAKVFGDVLSRDPALAEFGADALGWVDLGADLLWTADVVLSAVDLIGGVSDLADGVGGVAELVGGVVEGVGDLFSIFDV